MLSCKGGGLNRLFLDLGCCCWLEDGSALGLGGEDFFIDVEDAAIAEEDGTGDVPRTLSLMDPSGVLGDGMGCVAVVELI